jgi:hypothetical protein
MHDKKNQGTYRLRRGHAMKQGSTHPLEVQKSAKISDCRVVLVLVLVVIYFLHDYSSIVTHTNDNFFSLSA